MPFARKIWVKTMQIIEPVNDPISTKIERSFYSGQRRMDVLSTPNSGTSNLTRCLIGSLLYQQPGAFLIDNVGLSFSKLVIVIWKTIENDFQVINCHLGNGCNRHLFDFSKWKAGYSFWQALNNVAVLWIVISKMCVGDTQSRPGFWIELFFQQSCSAGRDVCAAFRPWRSVPTQYIFKLLSSNALSISPDPTRADNQCFT